MKLFFEKTNVWLMKNYQSGIALLLIAGFIAYGFRPIMTFSQAIGVVENVRESFYFTQGSRHARSFRVDMYVLTINGVEYRTRNRDASYTVLINKEVTFRYVTTTNARHPVNKRLIEIIYDGEIVNPSKDSNLVFIPAFVLFILGLFWCGWVLVLKWRK